MINIEFNSERFKEARIFSGKTLTELAEHLDISKQMISKYERGHAIPTAENIMKIEQFLGFPRRFFFQEYTSKIIIGNTYFRSLTNVPKKDIEAQKVRLNLYSTIYKMLYEYIDFPKINIPNIEIENIDIEEIASKLRSYWGLGDNPIKNMVQVLETNGIVVNTSRLNLPNIDAYTQRRKIDGSEVYFVVLGKDKGSRYRRQFDAAHELGHIILHEPFVDLSIVSKEEEKRMEQEANLFAAAFLLPKESFKQDAGMYPTDLEYYVYLKKKWHVSIGAMIIRSYNLNLITHNQYSYMQRNLSKRGWRNIEPLDDKTNPASPILIKKSIKTILEHNVLDGYQMLEELSDIHNLSITAEMFEGLTGIEPNTLECFSKQRKTEIVSLKNKFI